MSEKGRRKIEKAKSSRIQLKVMAKITLIVVIVVILITVVVKKNKKVDEQLNKIPTDTTEETILEETTYEEMKVDNIAMKYLQPNDQTMINMSIFNTTQRTVENEQLNVILLDADGKEVGNIKTFIQLLKPNEEYKISVVLKGNLENTKNIKLEKITQ